MINSSWRWYGSTASRSRWLCGILFWEHNGCTAAAGVSGLRESRDASGWEFWRESDVSPPPPPLSLPSLSPCFLLLRVRPEWVSASVQVILGALEDGRTATWRVVSAFTTHFNSNPLWFPLSRLLWFWDVGTKLITTLPPHHRCPVASPPLNKASPTPRATKDSQNVPFYEIRNYLWSLLNKILVILMARYNETYRIKCSLTINWASWSTDKNMRIKLSRTDFQTFSLHWQ